MSAPVLSWLFTAQGKPEGTPCPAALAMHESTIHPRASSSFCSTRASEQGPLYPTLRANPFPEVTDLFCRLPLSTLFYRPEASNLGDLMRLWVRARVRITCASDFQGQPEARRIPHNARDFTNHYSLPPDKMIPGIEVVEKNR